MDGMTLDLLHDSLLSLMETDKEHLNAGNSIAKSVDDQADIH